MQIKLFQYQMIHNIITIVIAILIYKVLSFFIKAVFISMVNVYKKRKQKKDEEWESIKKKLKVNREALDEQMIILQYQN